MKHNIELKRIKDYVDNCAGYDISAKLRDAEIVKFRTLYFILATETTYWSLEKIGAMVNRDHSTVLHAKNKMFIEIMNDRNFKKMYDIFIKKIMGESKKYIKLNEDYNTLLFEYNFLLSSSNLTENEKEYRQLEFKEKEAYDERAALVLKSFKWKARNEQAEVIVGSPNVSDARSVL